MESQDTPQNNMDDYNENDENEEIPEEVKEFMENFKKSRDAEKALNQVGEQFSEEGERKILMELWGELGNGDISYKEAFLGVAVFVEAVNTLREENSRLEAETSLIILKAIAQQVSLDAKFFEAAIKKMEEMGINE